MGYLWAAGAIRAEGVGSVWVVRGGELSRRTRYVANGERRRAELSTS